MSATISVRIPKELKEEIKKIWNQYKSCCEEGIRRRIKEEEN